MNQLSCNSFDYLPMSIVEAGGQQYSGHQYDSHGHSHSGGGAVASHGC